MKRSQFFRELDNIARAVRKVEYEDVEFAIAREFKKSRLFWEEIEQPLCHPAVRVVHYLFYNDNYKSLAPVILYLFEEAWEAYEVSQQSRPTQDMPA
jgi:hypothetical protein